MGRYERPVLGKQTFTCPYCDTLCVHADLALTGADSFRAKRCQQCRSVTLWIDKSDIAAGWVLVYPDASPAPAPNEDLPDSVRALYLEAASIFNASPRGAAALLRLGVQLLCKELGQTGKDINDDIAALVRERTLSPHVTSAMDVVRVAGNEAVHPGEINLQDDQELALGLFDLLNIIADGAFTKPRTVEKMKERMPEGKLEAIRKRDGVESEESSTGADA